MKIPLLLALAGLAISFAVPAIAQQKDTADPQLREALAAYNKKEDEAFNNGDAAALAALEHGSRLRTNRLIVSLAAEFQNVSHGAHGDL